MSASSLNRAPNAGPGPVTGALNTADEATITAAVRGRARRRRILLWAARIATAVIVIGGWQLFTSLKIVPAFFWGQPSGIVRQLSDWFQHGCRSGSR
jgi:NitT/TauT family transport system permease protein